MPQSRGTDSATLTVIVDISAHLWPIVPIAHSLNCLVKSEVSAPLATMMQPEKFFSEAFRHIDSVVLLEQFLVVQDAIELFTVLRHCLHSHFEFFIDWQTQTIQEPMQCVA